LLQKRLRLALSFLGIGLVFLSLTLPGPWASLANQSENPSADHPPVFNVYVFPNPIHRNQSPILHVETLETDRMTTEIFDVSGDVIYRSRIDDRPVDSIGDRFFYEHPLDSQKFNAGVYVGVLTTSRNGEYSRRKYRFAVLK